MDKNLLKIWGKKKCQHDVPLDFFGTPLLQKVDPKVTYVHVRAASVIRVNDGNVVGAVVFASMEIRMNTVATFLGLQ